MAELVTPALLRTWALPEPGDSKYGRGQITVVGGAASTPGAVMLSGVAALRVGAGRLTMAVASTAAPALAVAVPESAVFGLPQGPTGTVLGGDLRVAADAIASADVVVVGPGLDDPGETILLLKSLLPLLEPDTTLALDAFALGVWTQVDDPSRGARPLVLTPNEKEAGLLLGHELGAGADDVIRLARETMTPWSAAGAGSLPPMEPVGS